MIDVYRLVLRETTGFRIVAVIDGRSSARAHLRDVQPDVVLVDDMGAPANSLARIREAAAELVDAKVLYLTSAMDRARALKALPAGADELLSKYNNPVRLA